MVERIISAAMALIMSLSGCSATQYPVTDNLDSSQVRESTPAVTEESFTLTYQIPDTGVTDFYRDKALIEEPAEGEPFYGQDATYQINTPSEPFPKK